MIAKLTAAAGGLTILATGAFHLTGLSMVAAADTAALPAMLAAGLPALWVMPAVHWGMIGFLAVTAAFLGGRFAKLFLICSAVVLGVDAALMFFTLGPFIGEAMIAIAAVMFFVSGCFAK